jgi:hypothetical protein
MAAHKTVDYDRIEPGWRAGLLSSYQLAAQYTKDTGQPCSRSAIVKHFEKLGIPRDLNAKIQAKADAMVAESMVTGMVSTATNAKDAEIINVGAVGVATIKVSHRGLAGKLRTLLEKLITELEASNDDLRARMSCAKQASETLKTIVGIEADAWGFASVPDAPEAQDDFDPIESARRLAFILARADHHMRKADTLQ